MFKLIKRLFMVISIFIFLLVLFAGYHLYKGFKSGDLQSYIIKYAAESALDKDKLTPQQAEYLENQDFDSLVKDIEENITPVQIDCAVTAVGEERAKDLLINKNPTWQESLKLSKCL